MPIRPPLRFHPCHLALAAALTGLAMPALADDGLVLKLQRELLPKATDDASQVPAFVSGEHIGGLPDRELVIEGGAQLRRSDLTLHADRIVYHQVDDAVDAQGNVRLNTSNGRYVGPTLHYELDTQRGELGPGEFYVGATSGHGSAEHTEFEGRDVIAMREATYTTCPLDNDSWFVKARELTIDYQDGSGSGSGATVMFKGVPILASPYMYFPVGDQRRSGFLTPGLGLTNTRGVEVIVPYYFDIAPNRDDTLTVRDYSKRGLQLANEFRYLDKNYHGDIRAEYLDKDIETGLKRWSFGSTHAQQLGNGFADYWTVDRVSDNNYLSDFSHTIVTASNRQLTQEGGVTYNAPFWNAVLRVQQFQVLQDPAAATDPTLLIPIPYERQPQLTINAARYDRAGFDLTLTSELTHFTHPTQVNGTRAVVNPAISYPFIAPGWYVTPRVSYNLAAYSLDRDRIAAGSLLEPEFRRSIPTASIDSGMTFERNVHLFDADYLQTLEPRLFYVRTPYRDQNGAPLFDTSLADFNFAQLFSENRYAGQDRISDANQLTAAVSSRVIDPSTGLERLRGVLGQRFYFSDQRVGLDSNTLSTASKTDVLMGLGGQMSETLSADSLFEYDAANRRPAMANLGVRWTPERAKVLNFNYRFIRDELEQYDVSGQWRVSANWVAVGRFNYSTFDKRLIEGLAGIEYDGGCWVFRMVAQKYVTAANTATTSLFFQLELNGFASVGSSPLEALKRSVPGYQLINPPPGAASRFVQYE